MQSTVTFKQAHDFRYGRASCTDALEQHHGRKHQKCIDYHTLNDGPGERRGIAWQDSHHRSRASSGRPVLHTRDRHDLVIRISTTGSPSPYMVTCSQLHQRHSQQEPHRATPHEQDAKLLACTLMPRGERRDWPGVVCALPSTTGPI